MDCGCKKTESDNVRDIVREKYGDIARQGSSCCGQSSCCGSQSPESLATTIGYSVDEISDLPDGANMGLSCGNPTAIASLKEGEVVLDLGSGGGFDIFIAAKKVGASGRAIGVDMTAEMISRARKNAIAFAQSSGLNNVEFRLGEIEHLPVADNSVDVVISNCVLNLSPDKSQVWREISRVLKPGGRVSISDLALHKPLPDAVRESISALVGCIAGAVLVDDTRKMIEQVGLIDTSIECKPNYLDFMSDSSDPLYKEIILKLPSGTKVSDFVTSMSVTAYKPVTNK